MAQVYCPCCREVMGKRGKNRVWDNGWLLELGPEVLQTHRVTMEIQSLAKTDQRAYLIVMKEWGITREKRFSDEGWKKMKSSASNNRPFSEASDILLRPPG